MPSPRYVFVTSLVLFWFVVASSAFAERDIEVHFGLTGDLVVNRWNPIHIRMRNQAPSVFRLHIDKGSLLAGSEIIAYEAELAAGSGLFVFEDTLFIPPWRQLTWSISSGEVVLASGSLETARAKAHPLRLWLGPPLQISSSFDATKFEYIEWTHNGEDIAHFDSIDSLVVNIPSSNPIQPAPSPRQLLSVIAAGAQVYLSEAAANDYHSLIAADEKRKRYGAGQITRLWEEDYAHEVFVGAPLPSSQQLSEFLWDDEFSTRSPPLAAANVLYLGFVYTLIVIGCLRFAGVPGLFSALMLALLASALAYVYAPRADLIYRQRVLDIAANGLVKRIELQIALNTAKSDIDLPQHYSPNSPTLSRLTPHSTLLYSRRWQTTPLLGRPQLEVANKIGATEAWFPDDTVAAYHSLEGQLPHYRFVREQQRFYVLAEGD